MGTDRDLVHGLRERDPAALEALVDAYAAPVFALVQRILGGAGSAQDVEECVSDALHDAWARIDHYDPGRAPLRTWLLILAKYRALERRRTLVTRVEPPPVAPPPDPEALPEEALALMEERREVQIALARLAPLDRQLIYRRYFLDEPIDDLARSLGLTRQAADNRLWRARKTLRRLLAPTMQTEVVPCEG